MRLKSLEKKGKKIALALLRPLLGGSPLDREVLAERQLKRVLVVRQDERLGNVILTTPFLEALRRILPRARISALVSSRFADVLRGNPAVDEIISFDKRQFIRHPWRFAIFLRKMRRKAFDLAIDCGPVDGLSLNNALMTYLCGAPLRLGYLRGESPLFLNLLVGRGKEEKSEIDYHLDLLRFCFGQVHRSRIKVCISTEERQRAVRRQRDWGLLEGDRVVGMHIGGRGQKRWPVVCFARLAQRLIQDYDAKVVLFWGPGDRQAIRQFEGRSLDGLFIAPPLGIRDLASHLQSCDLFISGDTGPMHLAVAVGTPTVAIFRVLNYDRYGERGPRNKIVYRPEGDVSVDDVLAAFRGLWMVLAEDSVRG